MTATAFALLGNPLDASAKWGSSSNGAKAEAERHGKDLISKISFSGTVLGAGKNPGRGVRPAGNWSPPACWYEPRSAREFRDYVEDMYHTTVDFPGQLSHAKSAAGQFRQLYKDGTYKNYNLDKADQGNFWIAVQDPDRLDDPASSSCDRIPFWVENGTDPPVENAVTPRVLAELAYGRIRLPDTRVTLAPSGETKVNLATWAWLDKAVFTPVSVTAQLAVNGLDIEATTTAKPVSLHLEAGTRDAVTHPASGICPLTTDKTIGEPYTQGNADREPPCGITYLHTSGKGTFPLKATITWKITWTGTGTPKPTPLPDGTFDNEQPITVHEIQAVNR